MREKLSIARMTNLLIQKLEYILGRKKLLSLPSYAQIETTNKCNFEHEFCPRKKQGRGIGEMIFPNFLRVLSEIPLIIGCDLQGWGEPYLCSDLTKIVNYCKRAKIKTSFATNGSLLLNPVPDSLTVSVYPDNIDKIKEIVASQSRKLTFDLTLSRITAKREFLHEVALLTRGHRLNIHNYTAYPSKTEEIGPCSYLWFGCFIAWDGFVYPCCHYLDLPFGNIFEQHFREIWNSKMYCELRKKMLLKKPSKFCVEVCKEIII